MQIPYTIPYQHTQNFSMQHACISFQFPRCEYEQKEICTYNQSIFHKNEDFYDSSDSKEEKTLRHFLLNED